MRNFALPSLCVLSLILIFSCKQDTNSNDYSTTLLNSIRFQKLNPNESGVDFVNTVQDGKDFNVLTYRNFYNGGGVGIGDINNDGLEDLFFTSNQQSNRLYLNKGNLSFEDITESAGIGGQRGWSTGVSLVDINNDGYLDIYVSNSGDIKGDDRENELYINNGDLTFTENAKSFNLDNAGFSTHASFFDFDLDGDLDCYILNNSFKDPNKISSFGKTREEDDLLGGDRLMRNDGAIFTDVSKEAGIYTSAIGFGLGVSVSDINGDYLPDIYISNDFWERDYIYINKGDGTFSEELSNRVSICSVSSMGADIADINNDGHMDIFTTDMLSADNYRLKAMTMFDPFYLRNIKYRASYHYQILQNCLHLNDGTGNFAEVANMSEAAATDWSWGALIFDFNNDGWNDIYVCNGIFRDIMDQDFTNFLADKEEVKKIVTEKGEFDFRDFLPYMSSSPLQNYAFVNSQNGRFSNQASAIGFDEKEFSNGAAYGDLDNDGDYDLVINNVNMPASIYKNENEVNHYLKIKLKDESSDNKQAIGATVEVKTKEKVLVRQNYYARGFQSSVGNNLLFGLGNDASVESIKVIWPDRRQQEVVHTSVDTTITITKLESSDLAIPKEQDTEKILTRASLIDGSSLHRENDFNDFDHEILIPRMLSTEGPKIEVADFNGDGRDDFISLGSAGDVDKIFLQKTDGSFLRINTTAFDSDRNYESVCVAAFDNDQDGDLDLVIGSGGNDFSIGMGGYLLRFYENDGTGNFQKDISKAPPAGGQFSVIAAEDFDNDGDTDLFLGARSIPGNYGLTPRSFLLRKDFGTWVDVTVKELGTVGMVTDAIWSDYDGDLDKDLIIVGEWMPITIFGYSGGVLKKSKEIENSEGWWLHMTPGDLDNDGDTDFVLGNWGLNTKFKASLENPLTLYVKDFDKNGKSEFVLNWKPPGENSLFPFHSKMDMTEQVSSLKKKALKYKEYANLTYDELFSAEEKANALSMNASTLESAILWNNAGELEIENLPFEAQITPAFASQVADFNNDGYQDIWLGGNFYGLKPEVGRHNSSKGILLLGNEEGVYQDATSQSYPVDGEVRDIKSITTVQNEKILLIGINDREIQTLTYK